MNIFKDFTEGKKNIFMPLTVNIDPSNDCNFCCKFCPTGHPNLLQDVCRPRGLMELSLFKKIIDDIKGFAEPIQRLHLYNDGEPLLNPNFVEMVKYAKDSDVAQSLETTTNAHLLSTDIAYELVKAGLDRIRISVKHISTEGYHKTTGANVKFKNIVENVRTLHSIAKNSGNVPFINVTIVDTGLNEEEKAKFLKVFQDISNGIRFDTLMGWSRNDLFDFSLGTRPLSEVKMNTICPLPFQNISIKFNGEVSSCYVDWTHSNIIGDVKSENLLDIWNGERANAFRRAQLENENHSSVACVTCDYVNGLSQTSDFDAARSELKEIYKDKQYPKTGGLSI